MNPAAILSTFSGVLCLALSVVFYFKSAGVQTLSSELQNRQQTVQTQQQALQLKQQDFQNQQQQINAGAQLAQQVGPQVLNDLGAKARDNSNDKIKKLLEKYGVSVNEKSAEAPKAQ
ncbi:MAG TPA: hypothetical protein VFG14_19855 [Chthoniobacteraceae bacterium]|jgi:hypothetical protein|nr:hypothetical protein [Chthoniobacteraceae bacterium]